MLQIARANAASAGAATKFLCGDMKTIELERASVDAVVCLFDSIGYVQTNEALARVFQGIHRVLARDGILILEFWHAAAMLRSHEPTRVRRWSTPGGDILRISETELDCERQLAHVTYEVFEHHQDSSYTKFAETQTNRYFLVQEMAHWLTSGGLKPLAMFDGYSFEESISLDTWHVTAVARREGDE